MESIAPEELQRIVGAGGPIDLIDVRTPVEFREVHVKGARNVPLDELNPFSIVATRCSGADRPVYLICRSGGRGKLACEKFIAAGYQNVVNVEGGTTACEQAGLEVVLGRRCISLERQVRIAAGTLVLIGAVLALTVDEKWILLPAFVGAGLLFAGITDTCGMGLLLAKMPWNRVPQTPDACSLPKPSASRDLTPAASN